MKRTTLLALILFTIIHFTSFAQSEDEVTIRRLSQLQVESLMKNDTVALDKLWSPDYVEMNQLNKVEILKEMKAMMKTRKTSQAKFERVIDKITFNQNIATEMGREIPDEKAASASGEKEVLKQRHFTNIWMKQGSTWQLIARQATNTCP